MKAADLKRDEVISFGNGIISLHGRRLVVHDMRAWGQVRTDLVQMVGTEATRHIMTRFGYYWGTADAAAMTRIFQWDSLEEWLRAAAVMMRLQGAAHARIETLNVDTTSGTLDMVMHWHDSVEAEQQLGDAGRSDVPICWILAGYAGGYASFCLGKKVTFIEQTCRAQGNALCIARGRDNESWGDAVISELRYYQQIDHIHDQILELTEQLKEKTRALDHERARTRQLEGRQPTGLAEVRSDAFARVLDLARRVARFDSSVLITGESGVGKEVLARYIHRLSARQAGGFWAVNCAALPETLLESDLFGHKAGSFTGAIENRMGLFEQANGGTLFLDEIGDISPATQLKLLRVLQEREITPVGENISRKIDVRVIAATNQDLSERIAAGKFREDLYYRLGVIELTVPPLRERAHDIMPLARAFLEKMQQKLNMPLLRFDPRCYPVLEAHHWPGNVRELENVIERAAVLSHDNLITPDCLGELLTAPFIQASPDQGPTQSLAQVEMDHIRRVLAHTHGNKAQAARILGIGTATLWRKLKKT